MAEGDGIPPQFASEAKQMNAVLEHLLSAPEQLDWFFLSPAMNFGALAPGESAISGADFALAIVDEIENRVHRRAHFGVAY